MTGPSQGWTGVADRWPARAAMVAAMVPAGSSVVDLGAGAEGLRGLLPAGCRYTPVDRVARGPETVVLDLDRDPILGRFDVAVALGVVEYLEDPAGFLARVARVARVLLVSYVRPRHQGEGWRNRWTPRELRAAARAAGWRRVRVVGRWEGSLIWRCER